MLPNLEPRGRTLLWNARSFQEMSEEAIKGYYTAFREFAHDLFLMNRAKGFSAKFKEEFRVTDTVDLGFYQNLFAERYEFLDVPEWEQLNHPMSYRPMAWRHR